MSTAATTERRALCDLFDAAGPDEPTLCEGWTTRDLAAHLVVRERRPDGAAGVIVKPLAGYTEKVQGKIAAQSWDELVEQVRSGPPVWSPVRIGAVDRVANTIEFFVHHEDVRRAQPGWQARELPDDLRDDLTTALRRMAKLLARKVPVGLVLAPTDAEPIVAHKGEPAVTLSGPIGELVLFVYGRREHALVEFAGSDADIATVQAAQFGV